MNKAMNFPGLRDLSSLQTRRQWGPSLAPTLSESAVPEWTGEDFPPRPAPALPSVVYQASLATLRPFVFLGLCFIPLGPDEQILHLLKGLCINYLAMCCKMLRPQRKPPADTGCHASCLPWKEGHDSAEKVLER